MRKEIEEKLVEFYSEEVPDYIVNAGKTFLIINCGSDWEGSEPKKITIADVVEYYRSQAGNISSGCRSLAGIVGDWRNIDALAKECLEWFKFVNVEVLRRESQKAGLLPKF